MEIATRRVEPDIHIFELTGRMVLGRDSHHVESMVDDLLLQGEKKFIFDLTRVDHMDSAGLGILVNCTGKARAAGGDVRLVGINSRVMLALKMTHLDTMLSSDETLAAACGSLGGA